MTTTNGSTGQAAATTGGADNAAPAAPSGAARSTPAPVSSETKAITPGPSPAGSGESAGAAAPDKKGPPLSKGARALQRAQARQAASSAAAATPKTSEPAPGASHGPAATEGGSAPAGAAAPAAPAAGTSPSPDTPAADAGAQPPASTAEAPADWAADRRERFAAIKDPAGRALVLDMYRDMHAGFTTAMTHLAQERERHQELFTLDQQFQSDPKAVLTELAKRANLEVWFEPPASAGEIPDFKDPKEMAKWVAEQATRQARQLVEAERAKEREAQAGREAEAQRAKAREALTAELAEAHKAHPDFATHRPKVLEKLKAAPGLSVAEAYALVTLPALRQRVEAGAAAERELKALKAEDAKRRAAATQPPASAGVSAGAVGTERPMSAAERAYRKVAAKKAAAGNPAAH